MINEYGASNCNNEGSNCGDYEDWIELYNNTNSPIDLNGYYLSDRMGNPAKWQFTETFIIQPYSHRIIYASNKNLMDDNGQYGMHPTQTLNCPKQNLMSMLF